MATETVLPNGDVSTGNWSQDSCTPLDMYGRIDEGLSSPSTGECEEIR